MSIFTWRERQDKRLAAVATTEYQGIPASPKIITLFELPESAGACCCSVSITGGTGTWKEVFTAPAAVDEFQVLYDSGVVCFYSATPAQNINVSYNGLGSLVWARDVNTLAAQIEAFDLTKIDVNGTVAMAADFNMAGYCILSPGLVDGVDISLHDHAGGTWHGANIPGTSIIAGSIPADRLESTSIGGGQIAPGSICPLHLSYDACFLPRVSHGLLCTNFNGTLLGIGGLYCNCSLVTLAPTTGNTVSSLTLYNSGGCCFSLGICCWGTKRSMIVAMHGDSLDFRTDANDCSTNVISLTSSCICLKQPWHTEKPISIGTPIATDCLNIAGSINLVTDNSGLKINCKESVMLYCCVLRLGESATITQDSFWASGAERAYVTVNGLFTGYCSYVGDRLSVAGTGNPARFFVKGCGNTAATTSVSIQSSTSLNLFHVRDDGRVGINTDAPTTALHVAGCIYSSDKIVGDSLCIVSNAVINGSLSCVKGDTCIQGGLKFYTGGTLTLPTGAPTSPVNGSLWVI